jgi:hypothetical protein
MNTSNNHTRSPNLGLFDSAVYLIRFAVYTGLLHRYAACLGHLFTRRY